MAGRFVILRSDIRQEIIDHITATIRGDIHRAGRNLSCHRILNIAQIEVTDTPQGIGTHHTPRLSFREEFVHPDAECGTVFQVVGYRRLAPHLVPQLHRPRADLQVELRQLVVYQRTENVRFRHLPQLRMSVVVVGEIHAGSGYLLGFKLVEHPLGDHRRPVVHSHQTSLNHRRHHQAQNFIHSDLRPVEHLRYDDHRVMGRSADTEGKMAGRPPHSRDHKPVATRARIGIYRPCDHRSLVLRRFVAERRHSVGQRKVVVYGLRHMDVGDGIPLRFEKLRDPVGRRGRIVSADGHQQLHLIVHEEIGIEPFGEILVAGFVAAHVQVRTSAVEYLVRQPVIHIQHPRLLREKSLIAVMQSYHTITVSQKRLRHAGDHRIYSRRGSPARQNSYGIFHCTLFV